MFQSCFRFLDCRMHSTSQKPAFWAGRHQQPLTSAHAKNHWCNVGAKVALRCRGSMKIPCVIEVSLLVYVSWCFLLFCWTQPCTWFNMVVLHSFAACISALGAAAGQVSALAAGWGHPHGTRKSCWEQLERAQFGWHLSYFIIIYWYFGCVWITSVIIYSNIQ